MLFLFLVFNATFFLLNKKTGGGGEDGERLVFLKGYILKKSSDLLLCPVEKNQMSSPSPPSLLLALQAEVL